jgi:hypothetical protein
MVFAPAHNPTLFHIDRSKLNGWSVLNSVGVIVNAQIIQLKTNT